MHELNRLLAVATLTGLLAACGGGDKSASSAGGNTTSTMAPSSTATAAPAAAAAAPAATAGGAAVTGKTIKVQMIGDQQGYRFDPATITLKVGDGVSFV